MVEKLYWTDSYLKETNANITAINGAELELNKTIFCPRGGGQPSDVGKVTIDGQIFNIIEVKKNSDNIIHVLEKAPIARVGDKIECKIDWNKRYASMRYHTAVHVIGGVLENKYGGKFTGGQITFDKAHFDFDLPSLNRELSLKVIEEAQKIIDEGHKVNAKFLSKEEAEKIPNLVRTDPGQELFKNMEIIRVVEIEGVDTQFDGGTHVRNTNEIGRVELSRFENKGTHRKRIEIILK